MKLGIGVHSFNHHLGAEEGGQPRLHRETLSQGNKTKTKCLLCSQAQSQASTCELFQQPLMIFLKCLYYVLNFYFMCFSVLPASLGVWDFLELEVQTVKSYHVGAGSQTQVLWKNSQCS